MASTDTPVSIEWTRVPVALHDVAGRVRTEVPALYVYRVWQAGRPSAVAHGATLGAAVSTLLDRDWENDA